MYFTFYKNLQLIIIYANSEDNCFFKYTGKEALKKVQENVFKP